MLSENQLVGRQVELSILEPYEIARNVGEPPRVGQIERLVESRPQGSIQWEGGLKLLFPEPVSFESKNSQILYVFPRHHGTTIEGLLEGKAIVVQVYTPIPGHHPEDGAGRLASGTCDYVAIAEIRLAGE